MKLRNKKTNEIDEFLFESIFEQIKVYRRVGTSETKNIWCYDSIAEFNEEWEDVEDINVTSIPLIKDEKVRKAVRAWAEANRIIKANYGCKDMDVVFDHAQHSLTWFNTSIEFDGITALKELKNGKCYTIAELCGEEEG